MPSALSLAIPGRLTHAQASPCATATADPPELPPAVRSSASPSGPLGLCTGPYDFAICVFSELLSAQPTSQLTPCQTRPSWSSQRYAHPLLPAVGHMSHHTAAHILLSDNKTLGLPSRICDEHSVGAPVYEMLSFTATDLPFSRPAVSATTACHTYRTSRLVLRGSSTQMDLVQEPLSHRKTPYSHSELTCPHSVSSCWFVVLRNPVLYA